MKRRDFLLGSTGLISATKLSLGATPCPSGSLSVTGGTSTFTTCGTTPSWFASMPDKTWATPVNNTLNAVKPSNVYGNHAAICSAWTGGTVDQERGEFTLAANGGHADYGGNEVYVCNLRTNSPSWQRASNPSIPDSGTLGTNTKGAYSDGRPSAVHGWNRCTSGNGRIWYPGLDAEYPNPYWSLACWSFDRKTNDWTFHGIPPNNTGGSFNWQAGIGSYDRMTKTVWSICGYATQDGGYSYNTETNTFKVMPWYCPNNFGGGWGVIAHDLRVWILYSPQADSIFVLPLDTFDPSSDKPFSRPTISGNNTISGSGIGAVYHQPSRSVLLWNGQGANIRKLAIPSNPLTGTYVWSDVSPSASNTIIPSAAQVNGTYGRFNLVEDMGNGQSALCLINSTTEPVYIYKLPTSGV